MQTVEHFTSFDFPMESTLNMEELFKYEKILLDYNMLDFTRIYPPNPCIYI